MRLGIAPGKLLAGGGVQPLGLCARAVQDAPGLRARLLEDVIRLLVQCGKRSLGLSLRISEQPGRRSQRLVAGDLRLGPRGVQDLLRFLLRRLHAVLGGAVGLGDSLARPRLGLLAQLSRGAFGRGDDAGHPGSGAEGIGMGPSGHRSPSMGSSYSGL